MRREKDGFSHFTAEIAEFAEEVKKKSTLSACSAVKGTVNFTGVATL